MELSAFEKTSDQKWTEVIGPKKGWFDIKLGELWRYRDLVGMFVKRDFIATYKQTVLGPVWLILQPLVTAYTFLFIFNRVAKIPTDGAQPILFYLSGITVWTYFSDCLVKTSATFVNNANIFGKVYFPRLATPVSIVISNLVKFGIQFSLLVLVILYQCATNSFEIKLNLALMLIPVLIFIMALLGLGLGIIFSSLTTKYRDLTFLLQFGVQLLMYATPVIYPLSYTTGRMGGLIAYNPLSPVVETFRYAIIGTGSFEPLFLLYSLAISLIVLFAGVLLFNQVEKSFMDTV